MARSRKRMLGTQCMSRSAAALHVADVHTNASLPPSELFGLPLRSHYSLSYSSSNGTWNSASMPCRPSSHERTGRADKGNPVQVNEGNNQDHARTGRVLALIARERRLSLQQDAALLSGEQDSTGSSHQ